MKETHYVVTWLAVVLAVTLTIASFTDLHSNDNSLTGFVISSPTGMVPDDLGATSEDQIVLAMQDYSELWRSSEVGGLCIKTDAGNKCKLDGFNTANYVSHLLNSLGIIPDNDVTYFVGEIIEDINTKYGESGNAVTLTNWHQDDSSKTVDWILSDQVPSNSFVLVTRVSDPENTIVGGSSEHAILVYKDKLNNAWFTETVAKGVYEDSRNPYAEVFFGPIDLFRNRYKESIILYSSVIKFDTPVVIHQPTQIIPDTTEPLDPTNPFALTSTPPVPPADSIDIPSTGLVSPWTNLYKTDGGWYYADSDLNRAVPAMPKKSPVQENYYITFSNGANYNNVATVKGSHWHDIGGSLFYSVEPVVIGLDSSDEDPYIAFIGSKSVIIDNAKVAYSTDGFPDVDMSSIDGSDELLSVKGDFLVFYGRGLDSYKLIEKGSTNPSVFSDAEKNFLSAVSVADTDQRNGTAWYAYGLVCQDRSFKEERCDYFDKALSSFKKSLDLGYVGKSKYGVPDPKYAYDTLLSYRSSVCKEESANPSTTDPKKTMYYLTIRPRKDTVARVKIGSLDEFSVFREMKVQYNSEGEIKYFGVTYDDNFLEGPIAVPLKETEASTASPAAQVSSGTTSQPVAPDTESFAYEFCSICSSKDQGITDANKEGVTCPAGKSLSCVTQLITTTNDDDFKMFVVDSLTSSCKKSNVDWASLKRTDYPKGITVCPMRCV